MKKQDNIPKSNKPWWDFLKSPFQSKKTEALQPAPRIIDIPQEIEENQTTQPASVSRTRSNSKCIRHFNNKKELNRTKNKITRLSRRKNRKGLKKKKC